MFALDFTFKSFIDGSFDCDAETGVHTGLWLHGEKMDIGGGKITRRDIDRLKDYPGTAAVTISGLRQDTFEYFIRTYGKDLRAIRFFKNNTVEDWSLLSTLTDIEYLDFLSNRRIDKLWDMSGNKALTGLRICDFTKLKSIEGIAAASALRCFHIGEAVHGKMVLSSLSPLAGSPIEELRCTCKGLLDEDLSFLYEMKKLTVFDFPSELFDTEKVAWIAANFPSLTGYAIKPYIDFTERILNSEVQLSGQRLVVGKRKPLLHFIGNEERLRKYAEAFEALKERYAGKSYVESFPAKPKRKKRAALSPLKRKKSGKTRRAKKK